MLLRDLIELTPTNINIFVNEDEVDEKINKPYRTLDGTKYYAVKDDDFYPNGIPFEPEYDTLEVYEITSNIYTKNNQQISSIDIFVE